MKTLVDASVFGLVPIPSMADTDDALKNCGPRTSLLCGRSVSPSRSGWRRARKSPV